MHWTQNMRVGAQDCGRCRDADRIGFVDRLIEQMTGVEDVPPYIIGPDIMPLCNTCPQLMLVCHATCPHVI